MERRHASCDAGFGIRPCARTWRLVHGPSVPPGIEVETEAEIEIRGNCCSCMDEMNRYVTLGMIADNDSVWGACRRGPRGKLVPDRYVWLVQREEG